MKSGEDCGKIYTRCSSKHTITLFSTCDSDHRDRPWHLLEAVKTRAILREWYVSSTVRMVEGRCGFVWFRGGSARWSGRKERVSILSLDGLDSRQQRADEANYKRQFRGMAVDAAARILKWLSRFDGC